MKIVFFLALLANIVFFIWHYRAGDFQRVINHDAEFIVPKSQQIWLVSELEKQPPVIVVTPHDNVTAKSTVTLPKNAIDSVKKQSFPLLTLSATPIVLAMPHKPIKAVSSKTSPKVVSNILVKFIAPVATVKVTVTKPIKPIKPIKIAKPIKIVKPILPAPKVFYCYQTKSFSSKSMAENWARKQAGTLKWVREKQTQVTDYVVYYSMTVKKKNQLPDLPWIKKPLSLQHNEIKKTISVGIFKNEADALKIQRIWLKKGFQAKVGKRYKSFSSVVVQMKTVKTKRQLLVGLAKSANNPNLELSAKCN